MISPAAAHAAILLIVGFSIALMLIRPANIPEGYWIGAGTALLLGLRLSSVALARHALSEALDVCLFLIGMMLLSELGREHGLFDWLASVAMRHAAGSCSRLFALIYIVGIVVTVFLSNDATAVVLTPAILTAVRKAEVDPLPYVFACALVANAASFLLPISNPANLVVFHNALPVLAGWLASFALPCIFSVAATFVALRWLFRKPLRAAIAGTEDVIVLGREGKLVLAGIAVMLVVLLAAATRGLNLGLPTFVVAVAIAALVSISARCNPLPLFRGISWETLALVVGLFVMVGAIDSIGGMAYTRQWLLYLQSLGPAAGALATGGVVAVGNNVINNLPLGLIAGDTLQSAHAQGLIADAVLIGVDLGPNLSITGSLATILWLIALRKEKIDVSFWTFLNIGAVAMPIALLASLGGAIALHYLIR